MLETSPMSRLLLCHLSLHINQSKIPQMISYFLIETNLTNNVILGENIVKDIFKEHAEVELKQQMVEQVKTEPSENIKLEPSEININGVEIKQEVTEIKTEPQLDIEDVNISHPIAAIQVADREKQMIRKTLFSNVGPHRRALGARRDLMIRRHLCNLPIDDSYVEAPKRHDPELLKIATQLFERCL